MNVLAVDAGGTKTHFALCDEHGKVLCLVQRPGISLPACGEQGMEESLRAGIHQVLERAGSAFSDLACVCLGIPFWGEDDDGDEVILRVARVIFGDKSLKLCNDVEVGWAGSLALEPGINAVAGTGSIAFGKDAAGNTARCGGWSYHFSDEGSGYWLGKKLLQLFSKQSDGRLPRGPLYDLARSHFGLKKDYDINAVAEKEYLPDRDKVAGLQMLLLDAAREGDQSAIACYRQAAFEIAQTVRGVRNQLDFGKTADVSYSGGIFRVGALVLEPFQQYMEQYGCALVRPAAPPWAGGLMLALEMVQGANKRTIRRLTEETKAREADFT